MYSSLPKVIVVGGSDVDARLELMHCLKNTFNISALGSQPGLRDKFLTQGFDYTHFHLNRQANPLSDLVTIRQLVSIFQRSKPHIVHTFDTKPGVWGTLAARLAAVPVIVGTVTGLGSLYANENLTTRIIRSAYQTLQKLACHFSDLTIFQNRDDARQFITAGVVLAQKATVILGSGITTESFAPDRISDLERMGLKAELGIQSDEITVTMISRVIRSKGVLEFMAAAQQVCPHYPNVRFLLIGPEDKDGIDRLNPAELDQLSRAVIWPGLRRDIPALLAISDIFVFPSAYREGIPRVLLEAASMELPIVTTDSPGCNEVVENGVNGLLVGPYDVKALCEEIIRLIKRPDLRQRFGAVSRQRAVARFDLSVIADQTRELYQQLLAHKMLSPVALS
jgi:glycosyltransferase involved in cell wall biosynthesis